MKEIILNQEYFRKLRKLNVSVHEEADIYYKNSTIYKIFYKNLPRADIRKKEKKIEIISGIKNFPELVLPYDKLVFYKRKKKLFSGYTMDFLKDTMTLCDKMEQLSYEEFLMLISKISRGLKRIHKRNEDIVFSDLSFHNVLIGKDLNYYFIDLDNIMIGNLSSEKISALSYYYYKYRRINCVINKNFDRLTFLLYFLSFIFEIDAWEVSLYEYDKMSEKINSLKNIRSLFLELKKIDRRIPYVPYLNEVIGEESRLVLK